MVLERPKERGRLEGSVGLEGPRDRRGPERDPEGAGCAARGSARGRNVRAPD